MSEKIEFLALPETSLRDAIEMCRAVSLEPQFFEGQDSECDSEVWSDILDQPRVDEKTALAVLEMFEHAIQALRQNLKSKMRPENLQLSLSLKPSKQGAFVDTEDLLESMQGRILLLLREQAERLEKTDEFAGVPTVINCEMNLEIQEWLRELLPKSGLDGFSARADRMLGAETEKISSGFFLSEDIRAYGIGFELLAKKIFEWQAPNSYPWKQFAELIGEIRQGPISLVYSRSR